MTLTAELLFKYSIGKAIMSTENKARVPSGIEDKSLLTAENSILSRLASRSLFS